MLLCAPCGPATYSNLLAVKAMRLSLYVDRWEMRCSFNFLIYICISVSRVDDLERFALSRASNAPVANFHSVPFEFLLVTLQLFNSPDVTNVRHCVKRIISCCFYHLRQEAGKIQRDLTRDYHVICEASVVFSSRTPRFASSLCNATDISWKLPVRCSI